MKYKVSKEVNEILKGYPEQAAVLMKHYLREYFTTGKNPNFGTEELRDLWFYLKVHELADYIQRGHITNDSWVGTFEHLELQSLLTKYCSKFSNRYYRLEV